MQKKELIQILNNVYKNATKNETVLSLHLFGIKYKENIEDLNFLTELIEKSAIPNSYRTEIRKGMNLSKYVTLRNNAPV